MKKTYIVILLVSCLIFGLISLVLANGQKEQYFEKSVTFSKDATLEEKLEIASRLVPSPQQLEWQQLELTAFLHFGINTFTGREWGDGKDDPQIFDPTEFDADQWISTLKDSGFKMAIITAKHHDGFCLWPTRTTKYSVKYSNWRDGKGDVVADVKKACDKYGIKFGVYLSPWDRSADCYGDSPRYNQFFIDQLTELLTNYGEVHEVWFDGANNEGPNGKRQIYDWDAYYKVIHALQPRAVTAIKGDDVRWVGNEKGYGRETEWSATVLTPSAYYRAEKQNAALGINSMADDLGSRHLLEKATELFWYPSEVDVSIRPGWFYHQEEDGSVKSLSELMDIYYKSVGYNSVLLLNIPPDKRGLIHENDRKALMKFAEYRERVFSNNYVEKGNKAWETKAGGSKTYSIKNASLVNTILLQEDISRGQRVESFVCEGYIDSKWVELAKGTTIGYKRLLKISDCYPEKIRIYITSSRGNANISNVGAFYAPAIEQERSDKLSEILPVDRWEVVSHKDNFMSLFDNNVQTYWTSTNMHSLIIDLNETEEFLGFIYTPVDRESYKGNILTYSFYASLDGQNWTLLLEKQEFGNIENNPLPQSIRFEETAKYRYIKFEPLSVIGDAESYNIAGFSLIANRAEK